ncbi:GGDEF domain-containing protein [Streptomyces sp. NPDC088847]|uniref:GGDEF domain-containing protein n=1 Tax=Streptomyces sp. NPDC088847 TaxID=3365909 RepID=UPI003806CE38
MPATAVLRQQSRVLALAAVALPLAVAVVDDVRVRRHLNAARRDPLTGLTGRDTLTARIEQLARAHRDLLHVLVADADGLKAVNDTLGHAAGDSLIAAVGHRLGTWAQTRGGLAVRLGGDEFGAAVLLPPAASLREVTALHALLAQPVDHDRRILRDADGQVLHPAVSIGTARAVDLPDAADASRLLRGADMAMYRVKTRAKPLGYVANRHDAYTPTVHGRRPGRPGTHLPVA